MTEGRALVLDAVFYEVAGRRILAGAYLRAEPGRVLGLLGRNGSGKSILLKIAAGQLQPTSGLVDGDRLHRPSLRRRFAHIAYLPQDPLLPGGVRIGAAIRSFPPAARTLLDDPALRARLDGRVGELSTGEQRYLEFRLVLALGRAYTLLDEPFTGVEPLLIERMVTDLREHAARGHAFVLPSVDARQGLVTRRGADPEAAASFDGAARLWEHGAEHFGVTLTDARERVAADTALAARLLAVHR